MKELSLSAIGADRPGIVAALTGALAQLGCSIEDSEMAVLRGRFAVLLVLAAPDEVDAGVLEESLGPAAGRFDLVVAVRELHAPGTPLQPVAERTLWSISVHGADRPGIVHGVSTVLAGHGANISSLRTHVAGSPDQPLYVMLLEVALDPARDAGALKGELEEAASKLGVSVAIQRVDEELF